MAKAREFLANNGVRILTEERTRDRRYNDADALMLLAGIWHLYAAKGKKVLHFDLRKDTPGRDELTKAILGPSGYLRAPAAHRGTSLMVGFDEATYSELFL